jgi:PadR family transcriptional regulator PadR
LLGSPNGDIYVLTTYVAAMLAPDLKKGSAEFLVLSLLEHERRHGYELNKLIESRSNGVLTFHIASLYPLLYRMEDRGWIVGRWVEKAGERRRRFYSITAAGRRALGELRDGWLEFATAVARVTGVRYG